MKKVFYVISIIVLLLIINGLSRSIYELWSKKDIVTEAQKTLEKEKLKNQKLQNDLEIAQTPEFIESEARNKLFLSKPEEKEVVISPVVEKEKEKPKVEKPNWRKWLDLFL